MNRVTRVLLLAGFALLSACGGGGDSGHSGFIAPTHDFNAAAAWRNLLTTSATWVVAGRANDGLTYDLTISVAPASAAIFPVTNVVASRSNATIVFRQGNTILSNVLGETFFDTNHLKLGARFTDNSSGASSCDEATSASVPPAAATIGNSGALGTADLLTGCLGDSLVAARSTSTWSLEFEAGISYFCVNSTERNLAGTVVATESDCLEVAATGTLGTRARVTVSDGNFMLTMRS